MKNVLNAFYGLTVKNVDNYAYIVFSHYLNSEPFNPYKPSVSDLMCYIALDMILRGDY